jgi:hypothetical protein
MIDLKVSNTRVTFELQRQSDLSCSRKKKEMIYAVRNPCIPPLAYQNIWTFAVF